MLAKVCKASDSPAARAFLFPQLGTVGTFNGDDLRDVAHLNALAAGGTNPFDESEKILQEAREEADRIISEARDTAASETRGGKTVEEIQEESKALIDEQAEELRSNLTQTIDQISSLAETIAERAEADVVELALQIAKKIVRREVTIDRDVALTLVRVSLAKLNNRTLATVHLNPDELEYVTAHRDACDFRGGLELVGDRSISLGGCLVQTETGDIDARIESQFDEIAKGLFE